MSSAGAVQGLKQLRTRGPWFALVPVHNGEKWVDQCFESIIQQTAVGNGNTCVEVVVCNDGSTDKTEKVLEHWRDGFANRRIKYTIVCSKTRGVGAAKNAAIKQSSGTFLCFQDIDDVMLPCRVQMQLEAAQQRHEYLIGSRFRRSPVGSTARFTAWANSLKPEQLTLQCYTSHGPTLIMPTWFCHRSVYNRVGGFIEAQKGTPEDLIFFFKHLQIGGKLFRVEEELLIYTYHTDATTFSVSSETIWHTRINHLQEHVLNNWLTFSVWNAGKQGRKFVRSLLPANQDKVLALCDIDTSKIGNKYQIYCSQRKRFIKAFPIIHFRDAVPPIVICVKMGMSKGAFEANLKSMNLIEGSDYVMFS